VHLIRSILFAIALAVVTVPYVVFPTLFFWLPPMTRHRLITSWVPIMMWVIRHVLGIRYRVLGRENIPAGPAVVLSKHQSAWETIALQVIFPPLCYVLKRELLRVPFFGWALAMIPGIAIDRSAGKDALAQVVEQGRERLKEGLWVVVFPEGTRVAPGTTRRYKPGGAILAKRAGGSGGARWRTMRVSSGSAMPSSSARGRSSSASVLRSTPKAQRRVTSASGPRPGSRPRCIGCFRTTMGTPRWQPVRQVRPKKMRAAPSERARRTSEAAAAER